MGLVFNPLDVQGITGPSVAASNRGVIASLLAKRGMTTTKAPAGGDAPAVAPAPTAPSIAPPDLSAPAPVSIAAPAPMAQVDTPPIVAPDAQIKKPGMLDRVGDFLKSDEGRATMMRFAAGAFNGGIGGGLNAATSFADRRREEAAAATRAAVEQALKSKEIDNNYNLGFGRLGIEATTAGETSRHDRATESNDVYKTDSENNRHATPSGDALAQSATTKYTHATPSGDAQLTTAEKRREHDTVSGDTAATQQGENQRWGTPSGNTQLTVQAQTAPKIQMHARYQTTPAEFQQNGPRLRLPSQVKPAAGTGAPVKIASDADYANLPSGTQFIAPDGSTRVKP